MSVLLTTAYFPPISYFAAMMEGAYPSLQHNSLRSLAPVPVYMEACEHYQKQSYRNRCHFYAASGMQSLSFPVVHDKIVHNQLIKDIKIDYSKPWVIQHKRAIVSAYRTSAFFDYYEDELFSILDAHHLTLWEVNTAIIRFFIDKIGLPVELRETVEYFPGDGREQARDKDGMVLGLKDLREVIHPKRPDCILESTQKNKPYFQVFAQKHGFIPNLSVMDLLFNEGPNSISFL